TTCRCRGAWVAAGKARRWAGCARSCTSTPREPLSPGRCPADMNDEKRKLRQLKRDIKKAGQRKRRHKLKRALRDNPEEAHLAEESFGPYSSAHLNGRTLTS